MKFYFKILITLCLLSITDYTFSQPAYSFYFTTTFPVNEYNQFDDEVGYGGNFEFFFKSPTEQKPIGIGISFSYFGQGLYFYQDPCDCETYVGNDRANNFINTNVILQIAPIDGPVMPYIETLFGGSYIFSYTELTTLNYSTVDFYVDDWAWTYGVGGGFKFLINNSEEESGALYLDLKGRYMMSSEVELLERNSIRYANGRIYYIENETRLDYIAVQVGIVFAF